MHIVLTLSSYIHVHIILFNSIIESIQNLVIIESIQILVTSANCPSGQEYNTQTALCTDCAQGYYRTQGLQDLCVICPDAAFVTSAPGAGVAISACMTRE